jgi:flagellar export protein FliJ
LNRFQFRLARIQEYRHRQLEAAEDVLRRLLAELDAYRTRKQGLGDKYLAEEFAMAARLAVQPAEREALAAYRRHIGKEQARLDRRIVECTARVEKQRAQVMEAQRRYRLIEKLHQKRKAEWDLAFAKEIDALAEESFLARWSPAVNPPAD